MYYSCIGRSVTVLQAYLQESISNSNTNTCSTLDNSALDLESYDEGHVTGTGRDDVEAALSGRAALTNSALQVSNHEVTTLSVV